MSEVEKLTKKMRLLEGGHQHYILVDLIAAVRAEAIAETEAKFRGLAEKRHTGPSIDEVIAELREATNECAHELQFILTNTRHDAVERKSK